MAPATALNYSPRTRKQFWDEEPSEIPSRKFEFGYATATKGAEVIRLRGTDASNLERRFQDLADQWRTETSLNSSVHEKAMNPAYQRIIGMGKDALPFILRELQRQPDQWFWALRSITGEDPVKQEDRGRIRLMAQAWLEWAANNGFRW